MERNILLRMQLMTANENLLRIKGNLSLRGLIEEYELQHFFRKTRRLLASRNNAIASREQIWREILLNDEPDDVKFMELQKYLKDIGALDSSPRVICDIYNQASKGIHKPDYMVETLVLLTSSLYANQVEYLVLTLYII